jgi:uncharacterized protein (TIGR02453 family)
MFEGFSPETMDFLWGIRFNNNREWFQEHKAIYQQTLYEPMKALAKEVFQPFQDIPGMVCKVSRIYRDARYAHGDPYKTSLWFCIRRDVFSWSEHPALFFQVSPEGYNYGFGLFHPKADAMAAFRKQLLDRPAEFPKLVRQVEKASGETVTGTAYARKKVADAPELEPYINLKNLWAYTDHPADDLLFSPALADTVRDTLLALLPLNEYCQGFAY